MRDQLSANDPRQIARVLGNALLSLAADEAYEVLVDDRKRMVTRPYSRASMRKAAQEMGIKPYHDEGQWWHVPRTRLADVLKVATRVPEAVVDEIVPRRRKAS